MRGVFFVGFPLAKGKYDVGGTILLLYMTCAVTLPVPAIALATFIGVNPVSLFFDQMLLPSAYEQDRLTIFLSSILVFCGLLALAVCLLKNDIHHIYDIGIGWCSNRKAFKDIE